MKIGIVDVYENLLGNSCVSYPCTKGYL